MKCGLSNSYIAFLENNANPTTGKQIQPTIVTLTQIARAMEMDLGQLLSMVKGDSPVVINSSGNNDGVPEAPKTLEARIVSSGMDQLPLEDRERILNMLRVMYNNKPDLFKEGGSNETGL